MRRRQRSTRLVVAVVLLLVAALATLGAALSGSWLVAMLAAVLAVVLGAAATRITHTELALSRREAARDRVEQAQAYLQLTVERNAEQATYVESVTARLDAHETTIGGLERDLLEAQACLIDAHRQLLDEQLRADDAERETASLTSRLDDAEERAALAIVRVAELEQELDVVTSAWQAAQVVHRKHA